MECTTTYTGLVLGDEKQRAQPASQRAAALSSLTAAQSTSQEMHGDAYSTLRHQSADHTNCSTPSHANLKVPKRKICFSEPTAGFDSKDCTLTAVLRRAEYENST